MSSMNENPVKPDRRAQRLADRRTQSRTEILDAAEQVFGEDGMRDGSLRKIAVVSGFSTASIYLFFENKQHLLSETLTRRGDELVPVIRSAAESDLAPLDKLHRVLDDTIVFFDERPHFRLLLRHLRGGATITGPVLAEFADQANSRFVEAMVLIASVVEDGQAVGQIRAGNPGVVAHLYSVLVNEFVLLEANPDGARIDPFTTEQFHDLIDAAFRSGRSAPA
jgi:AcrR family transcriptional regulator